MFQQFYRAFAVILRAGLPPSMLPEVLPRELLHIVLEPSRVKRRQTLHVLVQVPGVVHMDPLHDDPVPLTTSGKA